jgi:hypothetical protein
MYTQFRLVLNATCICTLSSDLCWIPRVYVHSVPTCAEYHVYMYTQFRLVLNTTCICTLSSDLCWILRVPELPQSDYCAICLGTFPFRLHIFSKRARKEIVGEVKWGDLKRGDETSERGEKQKMGSEVKWRSLIQCVYHWFIVTQFVCALLYSMLCDCYFALCLLLFVMF